MLVRMDRYLQCLVTLAVTVLLASCGTMRSSVVVEPTPDSGYGPRPVTSAPTPARTPIPGGNYAVVQGDTLYSIAFRKGVDFRDLAQWNGIAAPYTIWPGQRLTLSPPTKSHAAPVAAAPVHAGGAPVAAAPMFEAVTAPSPSPAGPPAATSASVPATSPAITPPSRPAAPAVAATATTVVPVAGVPAAAPATMPPPAPPAAGVSRVVSSVQWRWPADGSLVGRFQSGDAIPGIQIAGKSGDPVRAAADGVVVYSGNGLVGYGELVIIKHNDSFLSAYGHNRKRLVKEGQRVSAGQQIAEMGSTGTTRNELEFQIRKDGNPVDPLGYLPLR
ncbi:MULTISPECIES: peptidoglycan DD-metalloendopeptidase family protein [unclassified Rhodanobacter]|uniref:peptidoglycan DD-metalloendopeptidase family protein n=1 Tax=unclassified Rhodanobacter TaxID=2621553 RepID=UPI001BE0DDEB|nr:MULTISPECIES: peptidoglycan DD-metalloendopeptidase family protein [unclassified Rhodanobacter]MBT2145022.1 peptidoglycan DD-metalloendopeptidase family protein [Rhodanobacter sp. LX-99]MBT2149067.1 peptidoglycan DD-metalloendopeptidase family protein [Rhodanobacter sp. LX-100]